MASSISIALRRAAAPSFFSKLTNPLRSASIAPSVSRSFNTNAQLTNYDDDRSVDVQRRSDPDSSLFRRNDPFSDVFDPFSPTRSLSQVLNWMDQLMENPIMAASPSRRGWDVKEDDEALYLRMDMPGLSKEELKVWVEQNTLVIKGEAEKASDEEESRRRYSSRLELPSQLYKLDSIKAEMKNGVLKLVVPKVKEDERKDVLQVQVE
ncbi:hypothetical protein UlMin_001299 [Ulmus minor]